MTQWILLGALLLVVAGGAAEDAARIRGENGELSLTIAVPLTEK